ncbi:hypothetical protein FHR81_000199 [Actinoalloteichus hoggarensis]|uniref:Uncharacterized protein n=1 Tax=Actinoalloteichus hoggarensis TaxID=1470176 RepID=A0A221W2U8_9PSEU|nr:hypothetical protein [Actinoalloteichus hoggarensis]ASO20118.1 hypothetical protein AHOG_12375 [Actinoalloteichus hoggarensis]MBB5919170.1 hypothetical protein [Actinoalloteichus hoggarensis]
MGELFTGGASSVVLRRRRDGSPAVLKLTPDRTLSASRVEMPRVFAPSGRVPAVLAADVQVGALVSTEAVPGIEAEDLPQESLTERRAELLTALHAVAALAVESLGPV